MTARQRLLVRAPVVMLLTTGALAVGSPAYADTVGVTVTSQFTPFTPGDTQPLKLTVTNGGAPSVTVSVTGLRNFTAGNPQGCDGSASSCTVTFSPGARSKDISFTLTATATVSTGQSTTDHGRVNAWTGGLLGSSATTPFDVTLTGPQPAATPAATVAQLSGMVKDITTGSPVKNAVVTLVDTGACARGKDPCQVGTDDHGTFTFLPTVDKPLTPGTLQVAAAKSGYDGGTVTVNARAGQSVTVSLALKPNAAASSSATPDAVPSADGQQPTAGAVTTNTAAAALTPAGDSGPSAASWVVIVLAGLLVLAGLTMLALVVLNRRKGNTGEPTDDTPTYGSPGVAMEAGSRVDGDAVDDADPTMVGIPGIAGALASPGASDATAIVRLPRPDDEFPDSYAAAHPASPVDHPQADNRFDVPADPYPKPEDRYGVDQPVGSDPTAHDYGPAYLASSQADTYDAGYGDAPTGYSPESHGFSGRSPGTGEAAWHWDDEADRGYLRGGIPGQRQGDHERGHAQQHGDNDPPLGYGGLPIGYGADSYSYDGELPRHDEATRPWDGGADRGYIDYAGGRVPLPWQDDGDRWSGNDQDYPQNPHDGGHDPYRQPRPTQASTRRGEPHDSRSGDRQRVDWFGN